MTTTFRKQALAFAIGIALCTPAYARVHTYDALHRVTESLDQTGQFWRYTRDPGGNILQEKVGVISHYIVAVTGKDDVYIHPVRSDGTAKHHFKANSRVLDSLATLDSDGDETDEIAVAGKQGQTNFIRLYWLGERHDDVEFGIPLANAQIASGDTNQDNKPEIGAVTAEGNGLYAPDGTALGKLSGIPTGAALSFALGDVNGDGKDEAVTGALNANQVTVGGVTFKVFQGNPAPSLTPRKKDPDTTNGNSANAPGQTGTHPGNGDSGNTPGQSNNPGNSGNAANNSGNNSADKVTVCHNGQLIEIAQSALAAHLAHGDTQGSCALPEAEDNGTVPQTPGADKTTVCHNGSPLEIAVSALPAHLAHGDTEGNCTQSGGGNTEIIYGARVATGDIDRDLRRTEEIIVAMASNGSRIEIYSGDGQRLISAFQAFENNTGLIVTAGDVDNDGRAEIIAAQGTEVRIFKPDGREIHRFTAAPRDAIVSLAFVTETQFYNENGVLTGGWQEPARPGNGKVPPAGQALENQDIAGEPGNSLDLGDRVIKGKVYVEHAVLGHVTLDSGATLTLGPGVRFKNSRDIPVGLDLSGILSRLAQDNQTAALDLSGTVSDSAPSLLEQLQTLLKGQVEIRQDQDTGNLVASQGEMIFMFRPVRAKQTNTGPGIRWKKQGVLAFVTPDGQEIEAVTAIQDEPKFSDALAVIKLGNLSMDTAGRLNVLSADGSARRYVAMPDFYSLPADATATIGISSQPSPLFPAGNTLLRAFGFKDGSGHLRRQVIYPCAVDPEALLAGQAGITLQAGGMLSITVNGQVYRGLFDYGVSSGTAPTGGKAEFKRIDDANGDGTADFEMTYPNGDRQRVYRIK